MKSRLWLWYTEMTQSMTEYELAAAIHNGSIKTPEWLAYSPTTAIGFAIWDAEVSNGIANLIDLNTTPLKKVQEMTEDEFVNAWYEASEGELVASNIRKKYSNEDKGYWYIAHEGDCDGEDTIRYWFENEMEENGYIDELNAYL